MLKSRSVICRAIMAGCVMAAGSQVVAQRDKMQFGNTIFRLPQGWRTSEQGGSLTISAPASLPGREVAILLAPSRPLNGDLRTEFDRFVRHMVSPEPMPAFGQVQQDRRGNHDMLSQLVTVGTGAANRAVRLFVAANPGGRFEVILAAAPSETLFRKHYPDFARFLDAVEYQESPAQEASSGAYPPRALPRAEAGTEAPAAARDGWPRDAQNPASAERATPSLPPLQPRPGWAIGRAVDGRGRPLKEFQVTVSRGAISTFGLYSSETFPGRDGHYEIELPKGTFMVQGFATLQQEGQSYRVDLQPLDGQEWNTSYPSDRGIVKDFVLLGSGLRAGQQQNEWGTSNLGGALTVEDYSFSLPPGTVVQVTLTPIGPLVDGSLGRVITRASPIVFTITDIPLGKYAVSVRIGGRPVDFELRHTEGGPNIGRGPLVFMPNAAGVQGVRRVRLLVHP